MKLKNMKKIALTVSLITIGMFGGLKGLATDFEPNNVLSATNWQGTYVYDEKGNDVTDLNSNFIGLARYDSKTNRYEFFDKETGVSRGDKGVYFVTPDGKKRILISQRGYNAVVDMVRLDSDMFTYRREGKQKNGEDGKVFVQHVPYDKELQFTINFPTLSIETGKINKDVPGRDILSSTFWQGTKALDENGNDVSDYNRGYLGLARYDSKTGRYEFFNKDTGASRGDYGYFDVINGNKERTHVAIGQNIKYAATLELTELNKERFTYERDGKDEQGNSIRITVEHEPYKGSFPLEFTIKESNDVITMPPIQSNRDDQVNSNAIVKVDSPTDIGTVRFNETANIDASIEFKDLNTKNNPTILDEKQAGKSKISVVDTRSGNGIKDDWSVRTQLTDGPFGNKGFLLNNLGITLNPTTNDSTLTVNSGINLQNSDEKEVFKVGYQQGNQQEKSVILNPQLTIGNAQALQTGVYGANVVWTLTPKV